MQIMRWCLGAIITHYLAASLHASKEDVNSMYALNKFCVVQVVKKQLAEAADRRAVTCTTLVKHCALQGSG